MKMKDFKPSELTFLFKNKTICGKHICVCVCVYIYIYMYTEREKEALNEIYKKKKNLRLPIPFQ